MTPFITTAPGESRSRLSRSRAACTGPGSMRASRRCRSSPVRRAGAASSSLVRKFTDISPGGPVRTRVKTPSPRRASARALAPRAGSVPGWVTVMVSRCAKGAILSRSRSAAICPESSGSMVLMSSRTIILETKARLAQRSAPQHASRRCLLGARNSWARPRSLDMRAYLKRPSSRGVLTVAFSKRMRVKSPS